MPNTNSPYTGDYYNPRSPYGVNPNGTSDSQFAKQTINQQHQTNKYLNNLNTGGGGGGGSRSSYEDSSGGGSDVRSEWANYWETWKKYLKTLYEKELATNRNDFEVQRNLANKRKELSERAVRGMTKENEGRGMNMLSGVNNVWANTIGQLRNSLAMANANSLANYNYGLANGYRDYANRLMDLEYYKL